MANSLEYAQQALAALRSAYIAEFPDRCDCLERLCLQSPQTNQGEIIVNALFREVHNVKGSAGTYGFAVLTTIAHQFEDVLSHSTVGNRRTAELRENYLAFVDLLRSACRKLTEQHSDSCSEELKASEILRRRFTTQTLFGLVIDGSKLCTSLIQAALSDFAIDFSISTNGYEALLPLTQERFDLVVTVNELPILSGAAVINALRSSRSRNKDVPVILVSSEPAASFELLGHNNFFVRKDAKIAETLHSVVMRVLSAQAIA